MTNEPTLADAKSRQNPTTLSAGNGPAEIWITHWRTDYGHFLSGVSEEPWDEDYLRIAPPITTYASNERYVRGDIADDKDVTIARLTAERGDWKARYFRTRDERDKAQIASANYANFNHEWRQRAERAEAKLAEVTAAGTFAQGIEAAAKVAETCAYGIGTAERIRALSPTPQADLILDDSSLRAQVGELGNQIHNLGCEYKGDERLAERLGELRSIAWGLARVASAAPQADPVREPTKAMLESAADWSRHKYGIPIGNDAAIGCWQAMYDALAGEQP